MADQVPAANPAILPTECEQLIDTKLNFHRDTKAVAATASEEPGTLYNVIATAGSQGSGCTTLLNDLFVTQFPTMGADFGQTTLGVSHAWSSEYKSLLLNIQGHNGGETTAIERKLTQFTAAAATVLIINLKQDEISRHANQNKVMLETMCQTVLERYEENDALRQPLTVLYTIRDWDSSVTVEAAEAHLTRGFLETWERVSREMGMADATFHEHFHLAVATLPHKVYDAEGYQTQIAQLRERFRIDSPKSIQPSKVRNDVPIETIFTHLGSVWKTARGRVNVTEERRDLSDRLCPLLVNSALQVAKKSIKENVDIEAAATEFKSGCEEARMAGLAHYDHLASAYDPVIVAKHRQILLSSINAELVLSYVAHIKGLSSIALNEFTRRLASLQKTIFPMPAMSTKVLLSRIEDLKADCIKVFKDLARGAKLNEEWSYDDQAEALTASIDAAIAPVRAQQAAIDASMEKSLAIFNQPINPVTDIPKLLASSIPSVGSLVSALWRS